MPVSVSTTKTPSAHHSPADGLTGTPAQHSLVASWLDARTMRLEAGHWWMAEVAPSAAEGLNRFWASLP